MSNDRTRTDLIDAIRLHAAREQAQWAVMFSQAAAERLGLTAPDLRHLNIVAQSGPISAGRLADLSGLTTGAITGVIDRLVKAGFVRREHDTADRRRVIVSVVPARMAAVGAVFGSSQRAWVEMSSRYTNDELIFIHDFLVESTRVLQEETARLRSSDETGRPARAW